MNHVSQRRQEFKFVLAGYDCRALLLLLQPVVAAGWLAPLVFLFNKLSTPPPTVVLYTPGCTKGD